MNEDKNITTYQINVFDNSYEFGKASNRFKLYFKTPEDLKKQIDSLTALGLYQNDNIE